MFEVCKLPKGKIKGTNEKLNEERNGVRNALVFVIVEFNKWQVAKSVNKDFFGGWKGFSKLQKDLSKATAAAAACNRIVCTSCSSSLVLLCTNI